MLVQVALTRLHNLNKGSCKNAFLDFQEMVAKRNLSDASKILRFLDFL